MTLTFIYRNKHINKIISVNSESPYRTDKYRYDFISAIENSFTWSYAHFTEINTEIKSFL